MRAAALFACFALLGMVSLSAPALPFDRDVLWRLGSVTDGRETFPEATFGFPGREPILRAGCSRLTHNLEIRYATDAPIPARLGDLEVIIEGAARKHVLRAERIEGGVLAWTRPTPALLTALHQDGGLALVLPYQREALEIGRAEPLRRVAELCRALNIVPPEDFASGRILDAELRVFATDPGTSVRFPGRLEISATVARYQPLAGEMPLEYAGRMPAGSYGGALRGAEVYRVVNAQAFIALNQGVRLCRDILRWVTITGSRDLIRVGWLDIEDWHAYRPDGPGFCSEQPYRAQ